MMTFLKSRSVLSPLLTLGLTSLYITAWSVPQTPDDAKKDKKEDWSIVEEETGNQDLFKFSADIPESPALALSGIDTSKLTTVNELREAAFYLPNLLGDAENFSLGLDISPWLLSLRGMDSKISLEDYENLSRFARGLRRTKASAVIQQGQQNDDPQKAIGSLLSIGFSTSLLDRSDPLLFKSGGQGELHTACNARLSDAAEVEARKPSYAVELTGTVDALGSVRRRIMGHFKKNEENSGTGTAAYKAEAAELRVSLFSARENILNHVAKIESKKDVPPFPKIADEKRGTMEEARILLDYESELFKFITEHETGIGLDRNFSKPTVKAYNECQKAIKQNLRFAPAIDVGAAVIWKGDPGKLSNFDDAGGALWLSTRKAVWPSCARDQSQICADDQSYIIAGGNLRYGMDETVMTGDDAIKEGKADTWQAWMGLEYNSTSFKAAAMYGYGETDFKDQTVEAFSNDGERWLVSTDFKMTKSMWLALSYGEAAGSIDALEGEKFLVTIKYSEPKTFVFD